MNSKASITVLGSPEEVQRRWADDQYRPSYIELMSLAITDPTGEGDYHGDVEAVRAANREDPHRKIHEGPPAVKAPNGTTSAAEEAATAPA